VRPREHYHSGTFGAATCPLCSEASGPPPWDPYDAALAFRQLLRERWPRQQGEDEQAWFQRAYEAFREGVVEIPPRTVTLAPLAAAPPAEEVPEPAAKTPSRPRTPRPRDARSGARRRSG
jgi:hypothetical protein